MSSAFLAPVAAATVAIAGVDVPYDILHVLLAALPDFATLHAALGVCSTWHTVFMSHKKPILLAVASNVVGPALPQAVRFIRYPYPKKTPNDWGNGEDEDEDSATEPESDADEETKLAFKKARAPAPLPPYWEQDPIGLLTTEERFKLTKNAAIVSKLEDLFVQKSAHTTTLSFSQYRRFSRAMYRIMLYCELFYLPLNLDDIDAMEDNEPGILKKLRKARTAHLRDSGYNTIALFEMRSVVDFLYELIKDAQPDPSELERVKDICLATGPAVILDAYEQKSDKPFEEALEPEVLTSGEENELFGGFLTDAIATLVREYSADLPISLWGAILDENDTEILAAVVSLNCAQCDVVEELWHKANWSRLIAVDFLAVLPGVLSDNDIEAAALLDLFMAGTPTSRVSADVLLAELFADSAGIKPEFAKWNVDERLCVACLNKFVSAHLVDWTLKRKIADGWKRTQNCWYGWNCTTQVHKQDHARTKNHLCAPIR